MANKKTVIGIDLGTTYSCVGIWKDNRVEIIANDQGNHTTASYVSFDGNTRLIGDSAKNSAAMNPRNTVFNSKRFIGRKFSDPTVQADIKHCPFSVVHAENDSDKILIEVEYNGEKKRFSPEEISSMVLSKMKDIAETYLGRKVDGAVITVPAYFNDAQRNATKDAGVIAGLNVMRIINEPTAAAIAYGLDKVNKSEDEKNIVVFDFGGGTHDITVMSVADGIIEVKATNGDTHLGGEDIDNILTDFCIEQFKLNHHIDLSDNPRARRRLQSACERAKRTLSSQTTAEISVDNLYETYDFNYNMSRARFEELCMSIFKRTINPLDEALRTAKLSKDEINEVVLVGGSTRIPKVKELLRDYFNGKKLNESINPDEAVAYGASVQAAIMNGSTDDAFNNIVVLDATPLTLSIETNGCMAEPMIPRCTTIPVKKTKTFSTAHDNQQSVTISIYEGERQFTRDCNKLGEFTLNGIPPAPRGIPQIEVTYDIDANSILTVTAVDLSTGKKLSTTVKSDSNHRSKEDIDHMVEEANKFKQEDENNRSKVESKNKLESLIYQTRNSMNDLKDKIDANDASTVNKLVQDSIAWMDSHQNEDKSVYEQKFKEIEDVISPIMMKLYQSKNNGQQMPMHEQMPTPEQTTKPQHQPKIEEVD